MLAIENSFRTDEPLLSSLLSDIHAGKLQLPDFQRGWVWDDNHISALIASISLGYPIGALMFMETGGDGVRFKPRLIEGVEISDSQKPEQLILDGQQRMTSLYLSLFSGKPVNTTNEKKQEIERFYYLDMAKCLDPEAERIEAIVSLSPGRMLKSDFGRKIDLDVSSTEKEYEHGLFPCHLMFNVAKTAEWKMGFQEYFEYKKEKMQFLSEFDQKIWLPLQKYKVPVIELVKNTPKEAVCQVFEKVNTGGVSLSVFELITATFAADDFELRLDWVRCQSSLQESKYEKLLRNVDETSFLTAITLLSTYKRSRSQRSAVSCKRRDILKLTLDEYKQNADAIVNGLLMAARLLTREKVFDVYVLPYQTQLIPLSAICAILGDRFKEDPVKQKLAQWYWCGVFGELYGGANETRYALDIQHVIAWIEGGDEPATIRDANFSPPRLLTLQTRNSAAYKGLMANLMKAGSNDFISGDAIELTNYFDESVDIHHIFPKAYCQRLNLPRQKWNSSINKAPLTSRTNRAIGGNKPSTYLRSIEQNYMVAADRLDTYLCSHLISPSLLRTDDFENFIRDRAIKLLDIIERAMGKSVTGRDSEEVITAFGAALLSENTA